MNRRRREYPSSWSSRGCQLFSALRWYTTLYISYVLHVYLLRESCSRKNPLEDRRRRRNHTSHRWSLPSTMINNDNNRRGSFVVLLATLLNFSQQLIVRRKCASSSNEFGGQIWLGSRNSARQPRRRENSLRNSLTDFGLDSLGWTSGTRTETHARRERNWLEPWLGLRFYTSDWFSPPARSTAPDAYTHALRADSPTANLRVSSRYC